GLSRAECGYGTREPPARAESRFDARCDRCALDAADRGPDVCRAPTLLSRRAPERARSAHAHRGGRDWRHRLARGAAYPGTLAIDDARIRSVLPRWRARIRAPAPPQNQADARRRMVHGDRASARGILVSAHQLRQSRAPVGILPLARTPHPVRSGTSAVG